MSNVKTALHCGSLIVASIFLALPVEANDNAHQVEEVVAVRTTSIVLPRGLYDFPPPIPSGDGKHAFSYHTLDGLFVEKTIEVGDPSAKLTIPARTLARVTFPNLGFTKELAYAWASDSQTILGVSQQTMPNGFALTELKPVRIAMSGQNEPLPEIESLPGRLDGLYWIGGGGFAFAEFDSRGGYYRPERQDPEPSLAFIDTIHGKVLDSIKVKDLGVKGPFPRAAAIDVIQIDGKLRAIIGFHKEPLREWREGETPKTLPFVINVSERPFALSPDGQTLLVMGGLSASGVICERNPNCPPPTATRGAVAELFALQSGELLWAINGVAENFSSSLKPVISRDGLTALINMPSSNNGTNIALISMRTGKIIQKIVEPSTSQVAFGFAESGNVFWVSFRKQILYFKI